MANKQVENRRLVFYTGTADPQYWDKHWSKLDRRDAYDQAWKGNLGLLERPFTTYLPKPGRILEAGCGIGQYVIALRQKGYDIEGIDFASETVDRVKAIYPDVPITYGDATNIDAENGAFAGYISLGVIEHRREGPEPFIREAARVLKGSGVAIFTVPYFNGLRRLKDCLGIYRTEVKPGKFYQYAFTLGEIRALIEDAGFNILAYHGYDSYKCLKDEIRTIGLVTSKTIYGYDMASIIQKVLSKVRIVEDRAGHMLLLVCQRTSWQ